MKWLLGLTQKQQEMRPESGSRVFELVPFSEGVFIGGNKANCAASFKDGVRIVYGTNDGVYFSDLRELNGSPVKMLALRDVTQVDILHESQELIVLAAGTVSTFPLEKLDPVDPTAALKHGGQIATRTSFFKAGICNISFIVCVVKTTSLSTTVKTFKLIDQSDHEKRRLAVKKLLQGGNDTLKLFKEFYMSTETHSLTILQSRLCIGTGRDFQIVDLETLDTNRLVDPADSSLDFIEKKKNLRPLAIFRVDDDFLVCYNEWAIFVNKRGSRARGDLIINWEGRPTAFAFHYPYVIAIEPSFVQVWDVTTCTITQVIPGTGLRCLFAESPPRGSVYPPISHVSGAAFFGTPEFGRRDIIIASDDGVLFLKLAPPLTVEPQGASNGVAVDGPNSDAEQLPTQ